MSFIPGKLPPNTDLETRPILKALARAHRVLAELKGVSGQIPNQAILINTLALQEARDSSAIENIITTQDELFRHQGIHPFYDGNGRTGRIINVLYLVLKGLLDIPVLYLSRHVIRLKADYYRLLQEVRVHGAWEEWVLYMLSAVEQTSLQTTALTHQIGRSNYCVNQALHKILFTDDQNTTF